MSLLPYNLNRRVTCPKCGVPATRPISVHFHKFREFTVDVEAEHLHGHCDWCGYDGVEYIFTIRKVDKGST